VDLLSDRHAISPYIYGVNFPRNTNYITDSGATLIRWGGNASTRYNWENFATNAANDWYFQNRPFGDPPLYQDSTQFVSQVVATGASPIVTIGMLPWVAKDGSATSYSYSVQKYGPQCRVNPYLADDGDGALPGANCVTNPVFLTGNDPYDAHVPLLDGPPAVSDPPGSVYRNEWVAALAAAFGSTAPHFYSMDNEMDIWGGTHHDVHPALTSYDEMRDTYLSEARSLTTWDPQAVRFGPVSCCWWFYWNSAAGSSDKSAHGGVDLLPWWLNEVYWSDLIAAARSLDVFDFHAYTDGPDQSQLDQMTPAQIRALRLRLPRDYWDPTYVSESGVINQPWTTQIQPLKTIPFRLPRMRAMLNSIYPNTPFSITEWNVGLYPTQYESDFSTALADADILGILGRERAFAATRWMAADAATSAYQALKLFRNYDGQNHGFGALSVSAAHDGNPNLFSVYAALGQAGTPPLTLLVINKDPANVAQVTFDLNGFAAGTTTTYTLSQTSPNAIVASQSQPWSTTQTFTPYSVTLLVVTGGHIEPGADWDLNPDAVQVAAGGMVTLAPRIVRAAGMNITVTLTSAQFDSGGGTMTITKPQFSVNPFDDGAITVTAGSTPGFFHFTVTSQDSTGVTQKQGGWLVVGNPAAVLTKEGDGQTGSVGSTLTLAVTLNPGQSGGTAQGATILFTTDAGTLSDCIVATDSSGRAGVLLTLPLTPGTVHVTAEGPYGLGHPAVTFTATAQ
jgi:hypothetical protein